ncbi:MAG: hypothetical protein AAB364_02420 [Patescibacteria group bacterium]
MNIKNSYNLPIRLERADYEKCVDLIRKEALSNPTVSAAYLMGGEWCPGISDLDIVLIYKDELTPKPLSNPWSLSEKANFIFTHRYLSFSQSSAEYFYFLYPQETTNLRLIAGIEHNFLAIPENNRQWTLAFILFDVLVNKLLLFSKFKKAPQNVRQLIGSLYSLVYTSWMVREISGVDIDHGFGQRIQSLRENWFALDESLAIQELSVLLEEGIVLVSRAVMELDGFVSKETLVNRNAQNVKFSNDKFAVKFTTGWSHQQFIEEFDKSLIWDSKVFGKKVESFRLLLPTSFSVFFQAYDQGEGEFSDIVRQHLSASREWNNLRSPDNLNNHVRAVNMAYGSSVASGGWFKIPYSYGFSAGKQGLNSKLFWKFCLLLRDIR